MVVEGLPSDVPTVAHSVTGEKGGWSVHIT